jgi:hypothetical protein
MIMLTPEFPCDWTNFCQWFSGISLQAGEPLVELDKKYPDLNPSLQDKGDTANAVVRAFF